MNILIASPLGFCAGVKRAITVVEETLATYGAPIYVKHEVVHNRQVIADLTEKGVIFIEDILSVPMNSILIFSAHGVSPQVRAEAQERQLHVIDACCPLVSKVHTEVINLHRKGYYIFMIGHHGHPEVIGTMGHLSNNSIKLITSEDDAFHAVAPWEPVAVVTQTTLSVTDTKRIIEILRERFPQLQEPKKSDICYATQNRQDAVRLLAEQVDVIIIVGSSNSSNSNRLREVASNLNIPSYLVDDPENISPNWFINVKTIGLSAGASAPKKLIDMIISHLQNYIGAKEITYMPEVQEDIFFALPKKLKTYKLTSS